MLVVIKQLGPYCIWGLVVMDMFKINTDRNAATKDRHVILLNKYFKENKYQKRTITVCTNVYTLQFQSSAFESIPANPRQLRISLSWKIRRFARPGLNGKWVLWGESFFFSLSLYSSTSFVGLALLRLRFSQSHSDISQSVGLL